MLTVGARQTGQAELDLRPQASLATAADQEVTNHLSPKIRTWQLRAGEAGHSPLNSTKSLYSAAKNEDGRETCAVTCLPTLSSRARRRHLI